MQVLLLTPLLPQCVRETPIFCGRPLSRFLSAKDTVFCSPKLKPSFRAQLFEENNARKRQFLPLIKKVFFFRGQICRQGFEPQPTPTHMRTCRELF